MSISADQSDRPAEDPDEAVAPASGVPAERQVIDERPDDEGDGGDPDAGPTATAEQVERDSERDQAEG